MLDLNKLRSEFEAIPEIKAHLDHGNIFWSDKNQTYASEFQCLHAVACYVNGAWFMFQEKAKAQAVPENHIVVPRTREIVVAIEKIVQQQCDASGVQEPLHRLDGWRILEEIAEKVKEIKG
ncbi:hypothetical protein ABTH08_04230 [Acinetobacter baumannii]|uniref:hypothetical protein n=1 Tax=Acinetobacter baumannii TaxID=470 RepID=UPI00123176CF|nr:hypothetical protein [Acinetobacter baumannii]EHU3334892.1 hypothetical protein [Acinetobacter baumannii]MCE6250513.1 hypothetical protein [Acinetobacter baumannii]WOQ33606.1 hypothetical protein R3L13_18380 [Acinetobacter baumannii]HBI2401801.1 hypothetical protein [Acinetobacter baumannii]HBI2405290.1 hypothetical protein [Acinetobacter baumannii]